MCESVRPFVSVCPRACSCVQMFDLTSLRSSMHAFVCLHARVPEGICLRPSVRLSVCPRAWSCVQMFVRSCVGSSMYARHFLFLTSYSGLSAPPPVIFLTDRSKAVLLLWFILMCYNIYNVCLLHDFVATLRLSALPSALYFCFVQASTVTTSLQ